MYTSIQINWYRHTKRNIQEILLHIFNILLYIKTIISGYRDHKQFLTWRINRLESFCKASFWYVVNAAFFFVHDVSVICFTILFLITQSPLTCIGLLLHTIYLHVHKQWGYFFGSSFVCHSWMNRNCIFLFVTPLLLTYRYHYRNQLSCCC